MHTISHTVIERDRTFPERTIKARPYPFICSTRGPCHSFPKFRKRVDILLSLSLIPSDVRSMPPRIQRKFSWKCEKMYVAVRNDPSSPQISREMLRAIRYFAKRNYRGRRKIRRRNAWRGYIVYNVTRSGSIGSPELNVFTKRVEGRKNVKKRGRNVSGIRSFHRLWRRH